MSLNDIPLGSMKISKIFHPDGQCDAWVILEWVEPNIKTASRMAPFWRHVTAEPFGSHEAATTHLIEILNAKGADDEAYGGS